MTYDGLGRLTFVTNALQKVTQYGYDEVGNEVSQTDALNRQTTFTYDALGRRTKRTLPGLQVETFSYDPNGNLLGHTDFNGLTVTNQYDVINRLTNVLSTNVVLESYGYDLAGQMTSRVDTSGAYSWVYDNRGRVTTNTTPVGTLYYGYDANGNQTSLSSATTGGVSVTYQYDALNRITNVVDARLSGTQNTAYGFDAVGNLQKLKYPSGITNLYQYDTLNRLTALTWKSNSTTMASFAYTLGPTGNRTSLQEFINGSTSVNRTNSWSYDTLFRMTNEIVGASAVPTGGLGYAYDAVGNRTNRTGSLAGLGTQTPTYNTNDWLNSDVYDSNGNTRTNGSNVYLYDYANRLTNFNGGTVKIVYGADGNRIRKATSSATNLYLIATVNPTGYPQVVEEFTVSGSTTNLSRVYTYGMALISQRQPTVSTNFFLTDGHGSTRMLLDVAANVANAFAYDAYGTLISSNSTPQTAYLYCCEQFDSDLGQYYLRARYMNPGTGRFWTMDTYEGDQGDPLSLHKFLFVKNDAANQIDPGGLDPLGHHLVPRAIWKNLSDRIKQIWDDPKNRLDAKGYKSHNGKTYNNVTRDQYQKAVEDKLDNFLKSKGKASADQLTDSEAQEFADQIRNTTDGPIGEYNAAVAEEIESAAAGSAEAEETVEILDIAIDVDEVVIVISE